MYYDIITVIYKYIISGVEKMVQLKIWLFKNYSMVYIKVPYNNISNLIQIIFLEGNKKNHEKHVFFNEDR